MLEAQEEVCAVHVSLRKDKKNINDVNIRTS